MGRFNYWKRGVRVAKLPSSKSLFKGKSKTLQYIDRSVFDHSPYWEMADAEWQFLAQDVQKFKQANPRASSQAVDEYCTTRRKTYSKRVQKLQESHQEYELTRLRLLQHMLLREFGKDCWDEALVKCDGTLSGLFHTYKSLV